MHLNIFGLLKRDDKPMVPSLYVFGLVKKQIPKLPIADKLCHAYAQCGYFDELSSISKYAEEPDNEINMSLTGAFIQQGDIDRAMTAFAKIADSTYHSRVMDLARGICEALVKRDDYAKALEFEQRHNLKEDLHTEYLIVCRLADKNLYKDALARIDAINWTKETGYYYNKRDNYLKGIISGLTKHGHFKEAQQCVSQISSAEEAFFENKVICGLLIEQKHYREAVDKLVSLFNPQLAGTKLKRKESNEISYEFNRASDSLIAAGEYDLAKELIDKIPDKRILDLAHANVDLHQNRIADALVHLERAITDCTRLDSYVKTTHDELLLKVVDCLGEKKEFTEAEKVIQRMVSKENTWIAFWKLVEMLMQNDIESAQRIARKIKDNDSKALAKTQIARQLFTIGKLDEACGILNEIGIEDIRDSEYINFVVHMVSRNEIKKSIDMAVSIKYIWAKAYALKLIACHVAITQSLGEALRIIDLIEDDSFKAQGLIDLGFCLAWKEGRGTAEYWNTFNWSSIMIQKDTKMEWFSLLFPGMRNPFQSEPSIPSKPIAP